MKRRIYKDDKCDSCEEKKPTHICNECGAIYCEECAEDRDFICPDHGEPNIVPIV